MLREAHSSFSSVLHCVNICLQNILCQMYEINLLENVGTDTKYDTSILINSESHNYLMVISLNVYGLVNVSTLIKQHKEVFSVDGGIKDKP